MYVSQRYEREHSHPTGTTLSILKPPIFVLACGKPLFSCSNICISTANQRLRGTPGSPVSYSKLDSPGNKTATRLSNGRKLDRNFLRKWKWFVANQRTRKEARLHGLPVAALRLELWVFGALGREARRPPLLRAPPPPFSASAHARRCLGALGSSRSRVSLRGAGPRFSRPPFPRGFKI